MAAEGPLKELWEEASCSICLDFFRDPVTIAECGHSFCRACLTRGWGESGASEPSCPQCRGTVQQRSLKPNRQLANFVEIAKKFRPLEGKGAEAKGGVCEKHREPLKFFCKEDEALLCLVCGLSQEHRDHEVVPLEEAFQENRAVVAARKGRVCQKHQEPLKLFCKDDEALICVVCDRSKEHRDHETLPLEEASQEYKDQFCSHLESLKKKRERIVASREDVEKESQDLLKQTTGEKQETLARFRQLHMFLEEQEKLLLAQMEAVEKEVARNRDQHLARISEELSSLESLIQEMEEKCQQPAGDLLQDVRSTLQRYEEEEMSENPVTFPLALKWRIWDFCDINLLLEGVMQQLKDNLDSGLHLPKGRVLQKPEKMRGGTSGPSSPPPELAVNQQENEILRPLLEQMQKINETLLKVECVFISRQELISETSRKMAEFEQQAWILSSQGVKEEEKEDLGFSLTNVLAPLTGSEAKDLKEEVDMAVKANSAFIKEITLPVEGEVEQSKQDIGDLIFCEVVMAPGKSEAQKRKKKDYILEMQRHLKRHTGMREDAALKIMRSSEENSSPGEGGEGEEAIKVKKDLVHNWKRFKKKTP